MIEEGHEQAFITTISAMFLNEKEGVAFSLNVRGYRDILYINIIIEEYIFAW